MKFQALHNETFTNEVNLEFMIIEYVNSNSYHVGSSWHRT